MVLLCHMTRITSQKEFYYIQQKDGWYLILFSLRLFSKQKKDDLPFLIIIICFYTQTQLSDLTHKV